MASGNLYRGQFNNCIMISIDIKIESPRSSQSCKRDSLENLFRLFRYLRRLVLILVKGSLVFKHPGVHALVEDCGVNTHFMDPFFIKKSLRFKRYNDARDCLKIRL